MKLHLSLKILILACLGFFSLGAAAVDDEYVEEDAGDVVQIEGEPPLVKVELSQDNLIPYLERRDSTGFYVGINYEGLDLKNYVSVLDNTNKSYAAVYGSSPVALMILTVDYKYNTGLGSLAAGVNYGMGSVSSSESGVDHKLSVTKYGVDFKWTLDALWPEPYVAPYLGLNLWQMGISDTSTTDSLSVTTQMGYNYTLGLLFQLDWIDYDAAKTSTFNWGLENTFLDIYATQYAKTASETDPNTATDFLYGAGLRLEY